MKVIESNPFGSLTEERLRQFEVRFQMRLPEEYRDFLLKHNGALVEPTEFLIEDGEESSSICGYFYGIAAGEFRNLEEEHASNQGYLPDECLAVADDGCGNYVCLAVSGEERGKMFFFDHETDAQCVVGDMRLIATSFHAFLDGLHEGTDEPEPRGILLFGIMVKAFWIEGNKPSALLPGKEFDAYLMKGRNKDMSKIPGDAAMTLLDVIVAGAKEIGTVSPEFVHGSVRDSIEYFLPGNHQISIGITDQEHLICEGKYWQTSKEAWRLISRLSDGVGKI